MSETIVIDTGTSTATQEEKIDPYQVNDYSNTRKIMAVPDNDKEPHFYSRIAKRLRMTLRLYGALGLSAPQCGINARLFVMSVGDKFITCINPKIVSKSTDTTCQKDMDISYPGMSLTIARPSSVVVEYMDETGKEFNVQFDGLTSRIFQQNLDHLNGVTITDHVGPAALMMAKKKQLKIMKKYKRTMHGH